MSYTSSTTNWASNQGFTYANMNRVEENIRSIYAAMPELVDSNYLSISKQNYETIARTITLSGSFVDPVTTYGVFERTDSVSVALDGGPGTYTYRIIRGRIKGLVGGSAAAPLALASMIPANYRPVSTVWMPCVVRDNGAYMPGAMEIATDGDVIFYHANGDGAYTDTFTSSGYKGFSDIYFSYLI